MDPDRDSGGPKTYGSDGSGFGSGSATLHLSLAQRWCNSLHSLHKDVVWVSVHILHAAAFWVIKYKYMKLLCVHLAWSCCQNLNVQMYSLHKAAEQIPNIQYSLFEAAEQIPNIQLAWSCRRSKNICIEHLAWSCHQRIYESLPRPFARTNPARGFTTPHLPMSAELL